MPGAGRPTNGISASPMTVVAMLSTAVVIKGSPPTLTSVFHVACVVAAQSTTRMMRGSISVL